MTDLSKDALLLCARFFAGPRHTVVSHKPHQFLNENKAAFDELLSKNLITVRLFNKFGSKEFHSTPEAARIGWTQQKKILKDMGLTQTLTKES